MRKILVLIRRKNAATCRMMPQVSPATPLFRLLAEKDGRSPLRTSPARDIWSAPGFLPHGSSSPNQLLQNSLTPAVFLLVPLLLSSARAGWHLARGACTKRGWGAQTHLTAFSSCSTPGPRRINESCTIACMSLGLSPGI